MTRQDDDILLSFLPVPKKTEEKKQEQATTLIENKQIAKPKEEYKQVDEFLFVPIAADTEPAKLIEETPNIAEIQKPEIIVDQTPIAIANSIEHSKKKTITHYPHKYKYGKQTEILEREDVIKTFEASTVAHNLMKSAYFWLMDYSMVRAHEGYNVKVNDCKLVPDGISIDFHRGKHSHQTPPLTLRKDWYGIDKLIAWYNERATAKASIKAIYIYSTERGAPIIEEKIINGEIGVKKTYGPGVKHMTRTLIKDIWLFPHIQKNTARAIMKAGYGNEKYYVHYSRLKGISSLCASPKASILSVRSVTGLSARTVEIYLGTSKKAANQAMDIIDEQIKGKA
jgi:hypothetical protein